MLSEQNVHCVKRGIVWQKNDECEPCDIQCVDSCDHESGECYECQ